MLCLILGNHFKHKEIAGDNLCEADKMYRITMPGIANGCIINGQIQQTDSSVST